MVAQTMLCEKWVDEGKTILNVAFMLRIPIRVWEVLTHTHQDTLIRFIDVLAKKASAVHADIVRSLMWMFGKDQAALT